MTAPEPLAPPGADPGEHESPGGTSSRADATNNQQGDRTESDLTPEDRQKQPLFQVMPRLSADEFEALKTDIAARGVVVPAVVDQHGRTLDGHHRQEIAAALGVECPVEVHWVKDDEDGRQVALALNLSRRHLTREQKRDLIAQECELRPDDSDRAVARRLGCSPSTVAAVRRPVSKLDREPLSAEEQTTLESLETDISTGLGLVHATLFGAIDAGAPVSLVARKFTEGWREFERAHAGDEDFLGPVRRHYFEPTLDMLLGVGR